MLQKAIPVLPVLNIRDSIDFYQIRLGFTGTSYGNYAILKKGAVEIHLNMSDPKKKFESHCCLISVSNVQDLYAELSARDLVLPDGQLATKAWGIKEFSIRDNSGNVLRFAEG